jgi:4-diphosphocytidyl-2-C-methyl-D-erythritol kinase
MDFLFPMTKQISYKKRYVFFLKDDKVPNLHIRLTKNIPSGAGLGGGSSDAAGTLMCLQKLFPQKKNDIFLLAKQLGCDVPFFLSEANRANAEGVGEIITPLSDIPPLYIVIGKPKRVDISTKWAYQQWDHEGKKGEENDFESVVFPRYKEIRLLAECLKKQNASPVRLCGSGASVYGSFSKEDDAQSALKQIDTNAYWKWSGKTITHRIC